MRIPTPLDGFEATYIIAAKNGRGEALFGDSLELVRNAYARTLIGNERPSAYLEFPLLGEPCLDLLSVYGRLKPGARFVPGAGYGYQSMIDWFSNLSDEYDTSCGIEVDLSTGETERAGAYFQYREHPDLAEPFLASVGEQARFGAYRDVSNRLPAGWEPAYIGLFPGRAHTPMRIGGYLSAQAIEQAVEDPGYLARTFDAAGFAAYDGRMLERCSEALHIVGSADYQFDIMPDGTLGDTFGLSLSFNETKPRQAHDCMKSGYGARFMGLLQSWGVADDRWKLIADAAFARSVAVEREDGSVGQFALCILFNYAKVKFTACEAKPAKFYFVTYAKEVADEAQ